MSKNNFDGKNRFRNSMLVLFLMTFLLISCATQEESVTTEGGYVAKIKTVEPKAELITPTLVAPTATEVVEVPYFETSVEERLLESRGFAEIVNSYKVLTSISPESQEVTYPKIYWSPTNGSWRSAENTAEADLDMKGESFPPLAIEGYENPDGSLVMIEPETGNERVFPVQISIPGIGEVSMRELYAMGQEKLGEALVDLALQAFDSSEIGSVIYERFADINSTYAAFLPGFNIDMNRFYTAIYGKSYPPLVTNSFIIPIFSPESGDFMFWLNIHAGRPHPSAMEVSYTPSGTASWHIEGRAKIKYYYGGNPADEFVIFIPIYSMRYSHFETGGTSALNDLGDNAEGVGVADSLRLILAATSEQQVLDLADEFNIIFIVPFRTMFPE